MSDIVKGEIVESVVRDYRYEVRAGKQGRHDSQWIEVGTELRVTAVLSGFLNVRYVDRGMPTNVFRVRLSDVRQVRQVGVAPAGSILPENPGLAWLWEDASRLATRFGFCDEFDRLADALGAPGRERTFRVTMLDEDGLRIAATVTARSRALAEAKIRDRFTAGSPLELTAARSAS